MIYDLAHPHYNHAPQFRGQLPNSVAYQQLAVVNEATVERCTFMSHSDSHVDAPLHYLPHLPCIQEPPFSHFYTPCIALDLRGFEASHPIDAFLVLIANAGGAWTRPVVWDHDDLDSDFSAPELASTLPPSVAASIALQRSAA